MALVAAWLAELSVPSVNSTSSSNPLTLLAVVYSGYCEAQQHQHSCTRWNGNFFLVVHPQHCSVADFVDYSPGFAPAVCGSGVSPARAASCQTRNIKHAERHFHVQDKVCLWELQNVHSEPAAASEKNKSKHFSLETNTQVVHLFLCLLAGVSTKKHN